MRESKDIAISTKELVSKIAKNVLFYHLKSYFIY